MDPEKGDEATVRPEADKRGLGREQLEQSKRERDFDRKDKRFAGKTKSLE
jgi:hypothetical protein